MTKTVEDVAVLHRYYALRRDSDALGDPSSCSVVALALVCGVEYREAYEALHGAGRRHGAPVSVAVLLKGLNNLGYWHKQWTYGRMLKVLVQLQNNPKHLYTWDVKRNPDVWGKYKEPMLILTSQHVCAMVDGQIMDYSRDSRLKVHMIFCVRKFADHGQEQTSEKDGTDARGHSQVIQEDHG